MTHRSAVSDSTSKWPLSDPGPEFYAVSVWVPSRDWSNREDTKTRRSPQITQIDADDHSLKTKKLQRCRAQARVLKIDPRRRSSGRSHARPAAGITDGYSESELSSHPSVPPADAPVARRLRLLPRDPWRFSFLFLQERKRSESIRSIFEAGQARRRRGGE